MYCVTKMKITLKKHKNTLFSASLRLCVSALKRTRSTAESRLKPTRGTMPTPPSRILDLCGSWICCSRFFPSGSPRICTLDSRRFGSAWVWHGLRFAGHGETGLRCGASRTWDYASERSAAKSHVRMPSRRHTRLLSIPVLPIGIMLRNVPQRNPTCGCPRADTLDSRRFPSTPADWDYASERSAAKSHVRMPYST